MSAMIRPALKSPARMTTTARTPFAALAMFDQVGRLVPADEARQLDGSGSIILAIPGHEGAHAFGERDGGPKARDLLQQGGARPCGGHVAGLHRQVAAQRLAADDLLDHTDEVVEPDGTAATDIDHPIGRAFLRWLGGEPDH